MLILCSGCATANFPARKDSFFQNNKESHRICLLPFQVEVSTMITKLNTYEQLYARKKGFEESFLKALKDELDVIGYPIVIYISLDEIKNKKIKEPELTILNELFDELSSADFCVLKNIDKEKGKLPDYSIGMRTKELKELLYNKANLALFIYPSGYIEELGATKPGMVAVNVIMSVGLSLLMPTPGDVIAIKAILVDMETGDIVWYNQESYFGNSFLLDTHIRSTIRNLFNDLSAEKINNK